jgi:cyclic beta-1,2-glucan synthetase
MYRAGLESILGLRRQGATFTIDPCIPTSWPEFGLDWRFGRTRYEIRVSNPQGHCRGVASAHLDGAVVDSRRIPLADDGRTHLVTVRLGPKARSPRLTKVETASSS